MKRLFVPPLVIALGLPLAADAQQPLYKLVDKKGKVTYAEKIPPGFDGKVIRLDVDPNRNTATLPKSTPADTESGKAKPTPTSAAQEREGRKQSRIEAAQKRLDEAKAALADALENPGDNDVTRVGNVRKGGSTPTSRNVWSDDYRARIEGLEAAVKAAEEELAAARVSE
jgi:hypothetical protein